MLLCFYSGTGGGKSGQCVHFYNQTPTGTYSSYTKAEVLKSDTVVYDYAVYFQ